MKRVLVKIKGIQGLGDDKDIIELSTEGTLRAFDDEYIIKIAREKLNLRLPEEIVYYNNLIH